VKQELEMLRYNYESVSTATRNDISNIKEWDVPRADLSDLLLVNISYLRFL
jgi:hypothetical protein